MNNTEYNIHADQKIARDYSGKSRSCWMCLLLLWLKLKRHKENLFFYEEGVNISSWKTVETDFGPEYCCLLKLNVWQSPARKSANC